MAMFWPHFRGKWEVTIDGQAHTVEADIYGPHLSVSVDGKPLYVKEMFFWNRPFALFPATGSFKHLGREFYVTTDGVLFSRKLMLFIDGKNADRGGAF